MMKDYNLKREALRYQTHMIWKDIFEK